MFVSFIRSETSTEAIINIIGMIAMNIRETWGEVKETKGKVGLIVSLCDELMNHPDCRDEERIEYSGWMDEIDEGMDDILSDGRWFRNWSGPYDMCEYSDDVKIAAAKYGIDLDCYENQLYDP